LAIDIIFDAERAYQPDLDIISFIGFGVFDFFLICNNERLFLRSHWKTQVLTPITVRIPDDRAPSNGMKGRETVKIRENFNHHNVAR
jgi:hypothetical protein